MIGVFKKRSKEIFMIGCLLLCFEISAYFFYSVTKYLEFSNHPVARFTLTYSVTKYLELSNNPVARSTLIKNLNESKTEVVSNESLKCNPRRRIAFLKNHKCASTTIQNILLRYGLANNLNFVLPSKGPHLGENKPFERSMIRGTPWEKAGLQYHMFLSHSIWNHLEIAITLKDLGDVFYFSIVRDPVELFRSWWDYYNLEKRYNQTLEKYASIAAKHDNKTVEKRPPGFNQMLYDFGLPYKDMDDRIRVMNKIKTIDETFDLILLADKDYFNDSIILLKDALCWDNQDMINFQLNSKNEKLVSSLSPTATQSLKGNNNSLIIE